MEVILDLFWTDMVSVDRQTRMFWGRKHEQRN